MTWTTCQPPRLSGIVTRWLIVPLVTAALPSAIELNAQQVLAQFTRLPTTVEYARLTVPVTEEGRPVTLSVVLVRTGPLVVLSVAAALLCGSSPTFERVVTWLTVGCTSAGQEMDEAVGPLSLVTLNSTVPPLV